MIVHRFPPSHRADDYGRVDLDCSPRIIRQLYRSMRVTLNPALSRLAVIGSFCDSEHGRVPS